MKNVNEVLVEGGYDEIENEELLNKVNEVVEVIGGELDSESLNYLVMVIEKSMGGNIYFN
jgi:hypothetical protein